MSDVDLTFLCNRVCTIDPYRAAVILKHVNYPLNRKKDARVIKSYRDAMMEHNWMRPIDISFVAVPVDTVPPEYRNGNGCIQNLQYFLVNGQHRLQALIESGTTQTANITVLNVEHWDSIGKVYSSFDTDIRKRTTSQIVAAANVTPMLNEKYRSATYKNNALRAMGFISGVGFSQYENDMMQPYYTLKELDGNIHAYIQPMNMAKMGKFWKRFGVKKEARIPYLVAVQEGWAPAPTNDVQKAIWDKVHALPTEPIKIKPEEKKTEK